MALSLKRRTQPEGKSLFQKLLRPEVDFTVPGVRKSRGSEPTWATGWVDGHTKTSGYNK